ncbi:MAG: penicillin-binding protein 2 [Bacteroidales bacterium]|nr:penicillin-binding protein 2 [Bacteroidales bacterium]
MNLSIRKYHIFAIIIAIFLVIWIKLFYLQIFDDELSAASENNSKRKITIYPARGLIYDSDNNILASNEIAHDLLVIPKKIKNLDTVLLCKYLDIDIETFRIQIENCIKYSKIKPSIFVKLLTPEQYATLQEKLYKFNGFFFQDRTIRKYNAAISAHILGDMGEVEMEDLKSDSYYSGGDYIGKNGIEKYYEKELRGQKGISQIIVDVNNNKVDSYEKGEFDIEAIEGKNLKLTINSELQKYSENIMKNKIGCIVAIDPKTGEILAMVSSPTYDPQILVGKARGENYNKLLNDSLKPLLNRAIASEYPPGSIFKLAQTLVALDENFINENTYFPCDKELVNCHNHPPCTGVARAIQFSCNPYFYYTFKKMIQQGDSKSVFINSANSLDAWNIKIKTLGFGTKFDIGLPFMKSGLIPNSNFYDKIYGKKRWAFSTIYSLAIGQGEILATPLQMANFCAIIANKGYYYTPYLVKEISGEEIKHPQKNITPFKEKDFDPIIKGMYYVVNEDYGTGSLAHINDIIVCGKTGTAQNSKKDHSVFIAFAPKDDPKIAISVYVENAGWGNSWAAPISRLIIEKYINNTISDPYLEKLIINSSTIKN